MGEHQKKIPGIFIHISLVNKELFTTKQDRNKFLTIFMETFVVVLNEGS